MKKMIILAMTIMATLTANAQFEPGTLSLQPRVGGTGAFLTNAPDIDLGINDKKLDSEPTGGVFAGADLEYQISNMFSVSAGVNWAQAGSGWKDLKLSGNGLTTEIKDLKIETSYVNVPITFNFYVVKGLALRTGVQMGFLTSADIKATINESGSSEGIKTKTEIDKSIKDDFNKFDLSIPVGISYEFNSHFVIDARYNIGITKVNKESEPDVKDSRNGVVAITLGYKFQI